MNELVKVTEQFDEQGEQLVQLVSAREVHKYTETTERFHTWLSKRCKIFETDVNNFAPVSIKVTGGQGAIQELDDYLIPIDIAKMFLASGTTKKSTEIIKYLVEVEKAWNDPLKVIQRSNQILQHMLDKRDKQLEQQRPDVDFANTVKGLYGNISYTNCAKLFGIIKPHKFTKWLRTLKYITRNNIPTQYSLNLGVLYLHEGTEFTVFGNRTYQQGKVTPKGQAYFYRRLKEAGWNVVHGTTQSVN